MGPDQQTSAQSGDNNVDTWWLLGPERGETEQGSGELVELEEVLYTFHLLPVVIILRQNLEVRVDVSLHQAGLHPEDSAHPDLAVPAHLGDVPEAGPDALSEADLVPRPAGHGDLQHPPSLALTEVEVADPA